MSQISEETSQMSAEDSTLINSVMNKYNSNTFTLEQHEMTSMILSEVLNVKQKCNINTLQYFDDLLKLSFCKYDYIELTDEEEKELEAICNQHMNIMLSAMNAQQNLH